jgi:hypothetical protein
MLPTDASAEAAGQIAVSERMHRRVVGQLRTAVAGRQT